MGASAVAQKVSEEVWDSYFKFTFERNPWDKTFSWYCFRRDQLGFTDDFESYCTKAFLGSTPLQLTRKELEYYAHLVGQFPLVEQ